MKMKINSAGALLFAIIIAFVLSLVATTLVVLTTNQYKVIHSELKRTIAYYRAQAGIEYALYQAYSNANWLNVNVTNPVITYTNIPITAGNLLSGNVNVTIRWLTPGGSNLSNYSISVNTNYET